LGWLGEKIFDGIWRFFAIGPFKGQAVGDLLTVANGVRDKFPNPQGEMTDEEVKLIGCGLADFQPDRGFQIGFGNADLDGKLSFRALNVPFYLH
jgi:hypothetical protein